MKVESKIKLKLFLFDLTFELIIDSIILLIAYFSNVIIETLLFYLSWRIFRFAVPKTFHFKANKNPFINICGCAICSILCFVIAMKLMLSVSISIFSSVIIGIFVNYTLYKIQDYIDLKKKMANEAINIYKMTEDELRNYARSKHLSEIMIDTLILKVVNNYRWCEIMQERNYSKTAIKYHKKCIEKKLNIKL